MQAGDKRDENWVNAEELLPITTSSGGLVWSSALDIDPCWRVPRNRVSFTPHALQGLSIVYRWNEGGMFDDRMSAPIDFRKRYRPCIYIYAYVYPSASVITIVTSLFLSCTYYQLPIGNAFVQSGTPKRTYLFEPQRNIIFIGGSSSILVEFKGMRIKFQSRVCARSIRIPRQSCNNVRWNFDIFFFWIGFLPLLRPWRVDIAQVTGHL